MGYIYRQTFIMKPTIVPIEILMLNNYYIYIYIYIFLQSKSKNLLHFSNQPRLCSLKKNLTFRSPSIQAN